MTDDRSHSRSGPESTIGARDGAGGINSPIMAATAGDPVELGGVGHGEPLPIDPTQEYVAKVDFDAAVETLTGERDAMKGDLQRIAADFENYKRRAAREREQASAATESKLLGELLAVIDDMERALEHADKAAETHPQIAEGVRMVHSRLSGIVQSHGLERVDVTGLFDPNLHEAMMVQPAPAGEPDDTILQVLQSGWKLGDRVLRHARVIVAGGN